MRNIDLLINNGINVNGSLDLLGDIDTYNDILKEFFNEANEKLAKINEYKNKNDMSNYAISVHSLKSDAKYLGFTKLAELAYNHEMESKNNNIDYINEHYEELISEAKNIIKIVNEYFNGKENTGNDINNLNKKSILIADDSNIIRNIIAVLNALFVESSAIVFIVANGSLNIDVTKPVASFASFFMSTFLIVSFT